MIFDARLEAGAVDDLHVNSHLATVVGDNEDTNGAATRLKGLLEPGPERGLVNDGKILLDVTSLGHGDDGAILHVEDAVLLEDGAEHGLDHNAGGRVRDERGLLMELLGEEVDTEVAVLASSRAGADADDLARAALQHQEVAEADVVAGNGDSVGEVLSTTSRGRAGTVTVDIDVHVGVVLMAAGVGDPVTELVEALAEGVVVTVLVVVTHLGLLVGTGEAGRLNGLVGRDLDVSLVGGSRNTGVYVNGELVVVGLTLVLLGAGSSVYSGVVRRAEALAVLTFGNVNGAGMSVVRDVDIYVRIGVLRARCGRSALLESVGLLVDTGTAVTLLFTRITDL